MDFFLKTWILRDKTFVNRIVTFRKEASVQKEKPLTCINTTLLGSGLRLFHTAIIWQLVPQQTLSKQPPSSSKTLIFIDLTITWRCIPLSRFLQSICSFSGQKRAVNSLWFPSFFLLPIQVKLQLAFVGNAFPTLPPLSWIYHREMALTALFLLLWKTLPCKHNCTNWMDIVLRCRSQYSKGKKNSYQREKNPQKCKCQNQRQAEAVLLQWLFLYNNKTQHKKKKFKKKNWLAIETAQDWNWRIAARWKASTSEQLCQLV